MQIRIPEEEISEMEELIEILHMSKSEVARNALHEGIKILKLEIAQKKYLNNEFTLCRAAEFADASIQEMADYLQKGEFRFSNTRKANLKGIQRRPRNGLKAECRYENFCGFIHYNCVIQNWRA